MPKKTIKLIHIITGFHLGGAEKTLFTLCQNLNKNKFDIYILALFDGGPLESFFKKANIRYKIITKSNKLSFKAFHGCFREIKKFDPDIVHTHLFGADLIGTICTILQKRKKLICTEHNVNQDYKWYHRFVKKILSLFTYKTLTISKAVENYIQKNERFFYDPKVKTFPYPVDISHLLSAKPKTPLKYTKFLCIARLVPQKGIIYLLEAFKKLVKDFPKIKLTIVGNGPLYHQFQNYIFQNQLTHNICLVGTKKNTKKILNKHHVFILPSLWEGRGIVILEAMAAGLSIITTPVGGIPENLKSKKNAFIIKPKNINSIYHTIKKIIKNPKTAHIKANKTHTIAKKYSLKKIIKTYQNLYLKIYHQ